MRLLPAVLIASAFSFSAFGQTYTISTVAGGGLPVGIPGPSASLGAGPWFLAADAAGNVFFAYQKTILRLDATTRELTLVAGNEQQTDFSGDGGRPPAPSWAFPWPRGRCCWEPVHR